MKEVNTSQHTGQRSSLIVTVSYSGTAMVVRQMTFDAGVPHKVDERLLVGEKPVQFFGGVWLSAITLAGPDDVITSRNRSSTWISPNFFTEPSTIKIRVSSVNTPIFSFCTANHCNS